VFVRRSERCRHLVICRYLHTKLSNPHYPPEVQAETALINFTVTEAGLGTYALFCSLVAARMQGI
jgi:hypothetical protein